MISWAHGRISEGFLAWAKIAKEVEKRDRPEMLKAGVVYWCNYSVNIGSELVGKGEGFSRPILVLALLNERLALVVPLTSQPRVGANYIEVMINGRLEYLVLTQMRAMDSRRVTRFIDELDMETFNGIKKYLLRWMKYILYRKIEHKDRHRTAKKLQRRGKPL